MFSALISGEFVATRKLQPHRGLNASAFFCRLVATEKLAGEAEFTGR